VLRETVVPRETTREQFAAFLLVARQYNLNPITKEIYAFPGRAGGIVPVVGVDGWLRIINEHPQLDGIEFKDHVTDTGELYAITAKIYRKDRTHPIELTEYMNECRRPTEPWNKWPARMLRHKALIQCARYAFGFSGIVEPDELERMNDDGTMERKKPSTQNPQAFRQNPPKSVHETIDEAMAAPKKVPLSTQPDPKTDVATAEAAFQMGREAYAKGAGKLGWPGFWRDQENIEQWMKGWMSAEEDDNPHEPS
jgi:phage recombination protein Bet